MKIISWTIINNEIDFVKDIIDYHLSWIDGMFFLDNGSTDGTLEYLKLRASQDSRIIIEEYPENFITQYESEWSEMSSPFPEVDVRNFAINQVISKMNPDWLIQLDADEVFTKRTKDIIIENENASCIGHSTINPVCLLEEHPLEIRGGLTLHDPHVRIWKADQNIFYMENPNLKGHQYHCIPSFGESKKHLFHHPMIKFTDEPIHFHLHWMYGAKLQKFYNKKGVFDRMAMTNCFINDDNEYDFVTYNKYSKFCPIEFWNKAEMWLGSGK